MNKKVPRHKYRLIARTSTKKSPPTIDIIADLVALVAPTVTSTAISAITIGVFERINWSYRRWQERKELYQNLLGFASDADYFIGARYPQREHPWSDSDTNAAIRMLEAIPGVFWERPRVEKMEAALVEPSLDRNLCFFGSSLANSFSGYVAGDISEAQEDKINLDYAPELPYRFYFELDPCSKGKTLDELKETRPKPNWCIKNTRTGEMYIPQYDRLTDHYVRDYGMVVKIKSIHEDARIRGQKNLMIAGCHGPGTEAAAMALNDVDILRKIFDEVGDRDFQAILATIVDNGIPTGVTLLHVESLY